MPTQQSLSEVLARADRAVIREGGVTAGRAHGGEVLLVLDRDGAIELARYLRISEPSKEFHSMCAGDHALELLSGNALIATIGLHHGVSIRTDFWRSDAELADSEAWVEWLSSRGMPGPLLNRRRAIADAERHQAQLQAFIAAAPPALGPAATTVVLAAARKGSAPVGDLIHKFREVSRDDRRVALELLRWFGSPRGLWSGYPSYEAIPEKMLLALPTEVIVDAITHSHLDDELKEGVARLLASWEFATRAPHALLTLPTATREELRSYVDRKADPDARARFAAALSRRLRP